MRPAALEGTAQRCARTEQMRLPDEFIEDARAQPVGQRPVSTITDRGRLLSRGHLLSRRSHRHRAAVRRRKDPAGTWDYASGG